MNIKQSIFISILLVQLSNVHACINTYAFELESKHISLEEAQSRILEMKRMKTPQELNDYGVLLIFAKRYNDAIQVFEQLEKSQPRQAKTAANLGTAYELKGDMSKAKFWIAEGIKREPNIHEGSEWIHLKILDAQLAQQKNKKWIEENDLLGLDFGHDNQPKPKIKKIVVNGQIYDLETIFKHSSTQMEQRLQFIDKDPITAQVLFNMANIDASLTISGDVEEVWSMYDVAERSGYSDKALLERRRAYIYESKWYAFKSQVVWIFREIKQLFVA